MKKRKTTKDKILELLKKKKNSSIKDLAAHIAISEVAIRRHINDLIRQRLIEEEEVKQEIGRPFFVYSLTQAGHQTFPNQYEQMPVQFLQDLETLYGTEAIEEILNKRKIRDQEEFTGQLQDKEFDEKVFKLVDLLEDRGYMIEYEKTEKGDYTIQNFHCPIYNVSSKYDIVCQNEKEMYKKIFPESSISDFCSLSKGNNQCSWVITSPENRKIDSQ